MPRRWEKLKARIVLSSHPTGQWVGFSAATGLRKVSVAGGSALTITADLLYLQGRHHFMKLRGPALEKALDYFTQVLALEPAYAQAHTGIAHAHVARSTMSLVEPHSVMPTAKEAALRALEIDESDAYAHGALAFVLHWYEWTWAGAERAYRRALELNPGDTVVRTIYAVLLGQVGRADESVAEARSSVERDPLSVHSRVMLAQLFFTARRFEEAITESCAGIELDPSHHFLYQILGQGLAVLGRYDETVDAFRQQSTLAPTDPFPQAHLGWALGRGPSRRGRRDSWRPRAATEPGLRRRYCAGLGMCGVARPRPSRLLATPGRRGARRSDDLAQCLAVLRPPPRRPPASKPSSAA